MTPTEPRRYWLILNERGFPIYSTTIQGDAQTTNEGVSHIWPNATIIQVQEIPKEPQ